MQVDVAMLGGGFAGSLTALLLHRIGRHCVLIDRGTHPRFAIGESSTPSANLVLRDLCTRYDLPRIAPLIKYGPWKATYPEIVCGPKRGFSYFQHRPGEQFQPGPNHDYELLVAASSTLPTADTHWLRSDVDHFLVREAVAVGVAYFDQTTVTVSPEAHRFRLSGERLGEPITIDADFLIDATGEAGVVLNTLGVPQRIDTLMTESRTIFGHFTQLKPWKDVLESQQAVEDHPFPCDQAAVHQVIEEGWMWQLRFDNGVTSAGFVLDASRSSQPTGLSPQEEWSRLLERYPSLAEQFADAQLVAPADGLVRTGRLQRRAAQAAGEHWAALPHTAGFIDPLHSSGIAQSLCGIERLVHILEHHWGRPTLPSELSRYDRTVLDEIDFIDEIVGCCYRTRYCFELFAPCCMLYFAAATTFERCRLTGDASATPAFLCADNPQLRAIVRETREKLASLIAVPSTNRNQEFVGWLRGALAPFNHVGLFSPEIPNMYRHTAVPETNPEERR